MISDIIAVLTMSAVVIQLFYLLYFFYRIEAKGDTLKDAARKTEDLPEHATLPLSVIVCAKNEAKNLRQNLPLILGQQYKDASGRILFEVVVADDASEDDTATVLHELKQRYAHLRVFSIQPGTARNFPGKKFALSVCAAEARYEHLVFTDADCRPQSKDWLRFMAFPFSRGKQIVAGYGSMQEGRSLLNRFIRFETLHTYLQFLSYNLADLPYMATGRNLACTKTLLLEAQNHPAWTKTPSGDDDLLVNICGTKDNMSVNVAEDSFTITEARQTWKEWWHQKQRHVSAGKYYRPANKLLGAAYAISQAMCWIGPLTFLIVTPDHIKWLNMTLIFCLLRLTFFFSFYATNAPKFGGNNIRLFFPFFDIGWVLYNFALSPYIFFKNKRQWK